MRIFIAILLLLAPLAAASAQSNWYVSSVFGNDANDGLSWATAKSNLQSRVQSLGSATTNVVWVGAGDYAMTNGPLAVSGATRIIGTNRETVRLIGAGYPWGVVTLTSSNQWIMSCTIMGGAASNTSGAGILGGSSFNGSVSNCIIVSNTSWRTGGGGGGLAGVRIWDSIIEHNRSGLAGGGGASVIASNCIIRYNAATNGAQGAGGGLAGSTLYACQVVSNNASAYGGGLSASFASGCRIAFNRSGGGMNGGGAFGGSFLNSTVEWNYAAAGAGSYNSSSTGTTYRYNASTNSSPGAAFYGGVHDRAFVCSNSTANVNGSEIGQASLANSVVHGDSSLSSAKHVALYNMVSVKNCTIVGYTDTYHKVHMLGNACQAFNNVVWNSGTNAIVNSTNQGWNWTNDPAFLAGGALPYLIASTSPCVDAGNNSYVVGTLDFHGRARQANGTVDIGAVELQADVDVPPSSGRRSFFWSLLF